MSSVPRPKPWETNAGHDDGTPTTIEHITGGQPSPSAINGSLSEPSTGIPDSSAPPPVPAYSPGGMTGSTYLRNNNYGLNQQPSMGYGVGSSYGLGSGYGYGLNSNYNMGGGFGPSYGGYGYSGYGYNNNNYLGDGLNNGGPGGIADSTRATFQLLENLVGTINGFAQMLESSYMATYNSFFTLISFAEELSKLRDLLGGMFGVFNVIKLLKRMLRMRSSNRQALQDNDNTPLTKEFDHFKKTGEPYEKKKRMSLKPLIVFFVAVFGFPYVLNKLIKRVHSIQNKRNGLGADDQHGDPIDPSKLEFARAIYDFVPENPQVEAGLKKGDLMAILSKTDSFGNSSQWWKVRTKSGTMGFVPYNYIEIIKRQKKIEHVLEHDSDATNEVHPTESV